MNPVWRIALILSVSPVLLPADIYAVEPAVAVKLYAQHCASCHGADRLGGIGPALLPENLGRIKRDEAIAVTRDGRVATQMPAFGDKLDTEQIAALTSLIYQPLPESPRWGMTEINASHILHVKLGQRLSDKPVFSVKDPLNLFIVVELGDHHATLLDGDRFEPITRFPTRFALHGGPKYSPDGRYVYFASRDGWISKYDIYNLKFIAEVRAGINTRNAAVSGDGKYVAVANYLPHSIVILDARDLAPVKVIEAKGHGGKTSRVSAVYDAAPRKSFIAALKDIPEAWEITYDENAEPVYEGLVHDYRLGEAIPVPGPFPVRRIPLDDYLDDFFFDQSYEHLIGAARNEKNGQVVNLHVRRKIAELALPGMPHLGSGITWERDGHTLMATPNLREGVVSVIDMQDWKLVKRIDTLGPGFFMRSHENTPYAWADAMMSPKDRDKIQIIDKRTLRVVKTLTPAPGKTAAHTEFTRDGKYALVSVWDMDGALVVYDAATFKEVKRLPMKKPSGKYNVYNKITRSAGTSH
ncbi:MAG: nitrite reductase [Gammaproteobacteria bacterium]|nr:nitrite reductase [Gammaproteobacteria bacterium]